MSRRATMALYFGALLLLTACSRGGDEAVRSREHPRFVEPRLVLLFATCSVNPHYLSPYDVSLPYTPALAEFARDAAVFRRHTTEVATSGPAYATLFSGTYTYRHGVISHPSRLADDVYLLAEAFADSG